MQNWTVTYYDNNNQIISTHTIENRNKHEAEHEAIADMPCDCDDWGMMQKKNLRKNLNVKGY